MADLDNLIEDALRAKEKPAAAPAAPAGNDIDAMIDEALAKPPQPRSVANRGMGIDTRPLKPPPLDTVADPSAIAGLEAGIVGEPFMQQEPPEIEKKAADAGVLYDKPARAGHALASLAWSDNDRRAAYEQALSAEYGRPITVEVGPGTGALEYLDPDTNRFALVDPPNKGLLNTVKGAAGGSMVMVPELAGGAFAALATKSPALVSFGAAGGAFAGEVARVALGQQLGINQDMTVADAAWAGAKAGGISFASGIIPEKVLATTQLIMNAFRGDAVAYAAKAGEKLGVRVEQAAELQDQINRTLAAERMRIGARNADLPPDLRTTEPENRRFALTLGEATGDADLLGFEDMLKRSSRYQARFGEFDLERQQAARDFYSLIAEPFEKGSLTGDAMARNVRLRAQRDLRHAERRSTEHLARYEADLTNALTSVDRSPMFALGDTARDVGDAEYGAFTSRANVLADSLRSLAGGARFIKNTNAAEAWNQLSDRARNIIIPALRRQAKKSQMISPKTTINEEGEAVLNRLYNPDAKLSFSQSWDTISRIKAVLREGGDAEMDTGALKKIVGAMEKDLYESANETELGPMYRDFTSWYRRENQRLNEGIVGKILQRDGGPGGRFTFASEQAFRSVFPATSPRAGGGITPTREFMDLIKNDPQAIGAFRTAIADDWHNYVVRDGRVDQARHAEWLNMHREQLGLQFPGLAGEERRALARFGVGEPRNAGEALFTPAEMQQIGRAEGFERVLAAREERHEKAIKALNQTFKSKLTTAHSPDAILNLVSDDLDGVTAKKLMRTFADDPATQRGIQAAYLRNMRERVMGARHPTTQEPIMSPSGLRTFLYGKSDDAGRGQNQVIRAMFGDQYANDLGTLEKALTMAARETTQPNRSNTSGWWEVGRLLVRAKFGVISREARTITSLAMLNRASADRMMAKAVMSPTDLRRLMSIWKSDIRNRKTAAVLGQLGFGPGDLSAEE